MSDAQLPDTNSEAAPKVYSYKDALLGAAMAVTTVITTAGFAVAGGGPEGVAVGAISGGMISTLVGVIFGNKLKSGRALVWGAAAITTLGIGTTIAMELAEHGSANIVPNGASNEELATFVMGGVPTGYKKPSNDSSYVVGEFKRTQKDFSSWSTEKVVTEERRLSSFDNPDNRVTKIFFEAGSPNSAHIQETYILDRSKMTVTHQVTTTSAPHNG